VSDGERESYPHPPYVMDFVRVRLSPVCRDLGESGDHRSPPAWYGDGWAALTERYHSPEWDGVVGQVQKRLVVEDPEEKHPYLVQCLFSGQSVPMMASAWFSAGELVEPARAEIAAWIPDPP
jgi:hypothetical protein